MTEQDLQEMMDRPNGPHLKNNAYYQPLRRREPTARYKSLHRNGRHFEAKRS